MLRLYSAASTAEPFSAPLFLERCQAGFPSPAADYTESERVLYSASQFNLLCQIHRQLYAGYGSAQRRSADCGQGRTSSARRHRYRGN